MSNGHVNHLMGGGRNGLGTLVNMSSINKMAGARSSYGGFQD